MKNIGKLAIHFALFFVVCGLAASPHASAQAKKPNIVVIMTDDVGGLEYQRLPSRHDGRPNA